MPGGDHACSAPTFCCKTQDGPEDGHLGELRLIWRCSHQGWSCEHSVLEQDRTRVTLQHCHGCSSPLFPSQEHCCIYWLLLPEGVRRWRSSRENHSEQVGGFLRPFRLDIFTTLI